MAVEGREESVGLGKRGMLCRWHATVVCNNSVDTVWWKWPVVEVVMHGGARDTSTVSRRVSQTRPFPSAREQR